MPSKKSSKKGKTKKALAGKAITFRITLPGKNLSMLIGIMAAMFLMVYAVGLLSQNGKITTRAVIVEKIEQQPEALTPSQACEQAGGEVVVSQDCSVSNVIQQDFGLKSKQVCCMKGKH